MKREQAKQLADEALNTLADALDQGKSEALTAYLAMAAKFHQYSFRNVMLIASQRPDASSVAGFHAWRKIGRFVKKGEKGIVIIAPMVFKKDETMDDPEQSRIGFRAAHVFDVSQTDGEPLPEPGTVSGDPATHTERLKAFISQCGIELQYVELNDGAHGKSHGGRIEIATGQTAAEEFSTLVHELAHEMMHRKETRGSSTKTSRETEAEAVAFVVCTAINLDTSTAARDYIHFHNGDKETLAASLDRIQQTTAAIIQAVTEDPIPQAQAA